MPSASQTPTDQAPADALARQLRVFKLLAAFLAAVLVIGGGAFLYIRHLGQPVTIFINGKPVATVRNAAAANTLIAAAEKAKIGAAFAAETPVRLQRLSLLHAAPDAPQDPDDAVQSKLEKLLTLRVPAFVILVSKQPSLAFPTPDAATETLKLVQAHWVQMPPAAPITGQAQITQPITIEKRTVDTRLLRSDPEKAAAYYWTPPVSKTYIVRAGDLGSRIASRSHISLADLIRANPNINLNRLQPGDTINVQKMPLLLTVRVRKTLVNTEKVRPNVPAYAAGSQRVTYLVTYLNGQEVSREAQSVVILEKPHTASEL
ncbi:MAG: LysM peptidoglycan-binding domain-containing protein [Janthinobacterium lividum]